MGSARLGRPHVHQPRSAMKLSVACALLASLPLCLSESASGLSHVVKVGRNGRQVVHQSINSKGNSGKSLGRKVRRRGRNTLGQPAAALRQAPAAPVPLVPQVFAAHPTHQHVVHHAAPALPAPQAFSHHHVPHAPANLFHFAHHGPAIDPNLHHPALHQTVAAPLAPVQFVAPAFVHHPTAPLPVAPLPIAPVQQVQVAAPAPPALPEDAPAVIAVGRAADPAPAPAPVEVAEVQTPVTLYGAPAEEVEVEVAKIADSYLAVPEPAVAPADSYLPSEPEPLPVPVPVEVPAPSAPVVVEIALKEAVAPRDSYIQPVVAAPEPVAPIVVEAVDSYGAPAAPAPVVVEARDSYGAPSEPATAVVKSDVLAATRVDPIAIVRSVLNAPDTVRAAKDGWDYSYEAANGIKQEATGTLRQIDDSRVSVMQGSYEFVGADGIVYAVEWFADETGFHATAPHLPQNVVPNHPEVAAAVKAQIAFAEQEDLASASGIVAARAPLDSYGALPAYGYY